MLHLHPKHSTKLLSTCGDATKDIQNQRKEQIHDYKITLCEGMAAGAILNQTGKWHTGELTCELTHVAV